MIKNITKLFQCVNNKKKTKMHEYNIDLTLLQKPDLQKRTCNYLHIYGTLSELAGIISSITSCMTEKAKSTVMARDTFSPLSAGSQKTPKATSKTNTVGQMMLNTGYWNLRFHVKST